MFTGSFRERQPQSALFAMAITHCRFFRCFIASTAASACLNWLMFSNSRSDCWDNASEEMTTVRTTMPTNHRNIFCPSVRYLAPQYIQQHRCSETDRQPRRRMPVHTTKGKAGITAGQSLRSPVTPRRNGRLFLHRFHSTNARIKSGHDDVQLVSDLKLSYDWHH